MKTDILFGQEALSFVTSSHGPEVRVKSGSQPLAFNADIDLASVPEHLKPWAKRWAPVLRNDAAFVANSFLDKKEWADLDRAIFEMVKLRRNAVADLQSHGLWKTADLATMLSQWRVASERVRPSVSMDGRTRADRDRTDRKTYGVPIPIFRTDYDFSRRDLLAARRLGQVIDTFEAAEAAGAIAEEQERMLFDGNAGIVVQGAAIYGYTNHPGRDTATAAAYGGGDFATISNITPTFTGMIAALNALRYYGPFMCYVYNTQYNQMLDFYTDGSGDMGVDRVKRLPQIEDVKPSDLLAIC